MKFRGRLIWICIPAVVALTFALFFGPLLLLERPSYDAPDRGKKVFISREADRYVLYRNGQPFMVKGASGNAWLKELHEAGGNTVRTYDTVGLGAVLDEAQRNHIAVIAGLPIPYSDYLDEFYKDGRKVKGMYEAYRETVARYKNHPALLMWCLGNEPRMTWKPGYDAFYDAYNRMLEMIHATDPDHPVTTTMPNFNIVQIMMIRRKVPALDLISFNTFGKLKRLNQQLGRFAWLWDGPFLIMEWGAYGPWESETTAWQAPIENTSTKKAEHFLRIYREQMPAQHPRFLGALAFYWGQKQEVTPTWFSLFSETGAASGAVATLRNIWQASAPENDAPQLKYMLVDGKGARDNIILMPASETQAEFFMEDHNKSNTVTAQWQIMKEDWYEDTRKKRPLKKLLDTVMPAGNNNRFSFRAPRAEGPYRIYVTVADDRGHIATANTPFYVVE